jgi:hypothetical protein
MEDLEDVAAPLSGSSAVSEVATPSMLVESDTVFSRHLLRIYYFFFSEFSRPKLLACNCLLSLIPARNWWMDIPSQTVFASSTQLWY